jgi:hypothetical protein
MSTSEARVWSRPPVVVETIIHNNPDDQEYHEEPKCQEKKFTYGHQPKSNQATSARSLTGVCFVLRLHVVPHFVRRQGDRWGVFPMSVRSPSSSSQSASSQRLARTLTQKKGPDTVMVGVLSVALVLGLVGLALHVLWVVAIIVMALGLGYTIANSRRHRIDVVNQRAEKRSGSSAQSR